MNLCLLAAGGADILVAEGVKEVKNGWFGK